MSGRIMVAGIGNIFFGDDGFGPEVARRLATTELPDGVRVVDYGIRGMHLAYDLLDGYGALVIVDALPHRAAPGDLVVLQVGPEDLGTGEFDAHGMEPTAVLANIEMLGGELPPTYVVGCQPSELDENIGLTAPVEAAVDRAVELVHDLFANQLREVLSTAAAHSGATARNDEE